MRTVEPFSQIGNEKGMTLVEVIVAMSVGTIILATTLFVLLTTNRTYNTLMSSYDITSVQTMILEHIKERGVANARSLTLLGEGENPSGGTNWMKWEENNLYFNDNIVYSPRVQEDIDVYFTSMGKILTINVRVGNSNYVTSDIYLHNLEGNIGTRGSPVEEVFTIIEWST